MATYTPLEELQPRLRSEHNPTRWRAQRQLLAEHHGLVMQAVNKYGPAIMAANPIYDRDVLESEAERILLNAAETFDPEKAVWSTHATHQLRRLTAMARTNGDTYNRGQRHDPTSKDEPDQFHLASLPDHAADPAEYLSCCEAMRAISTLPPMSRHRMLMIATGATFSDIARAEGATPQATRFRVAQARKQITSSYK